MRGLPNRPRLYCVVFHTVSNMSVASSCGTRPILRARRAEVAHDVVAVGGDGAGRGRDDAADDVDQRGLAGAVRPEQREDLAAADLEVDVLEGVEAGGVGLGKTRDGEHGHGPLS